MNNDVLNHTENKSEEFKKKLELLSILLSSCGLIIILLMIILELIFEIWMWLNFFL